MKKIAIIIWSSIIIFSCNKKSDKCNIELLQEKYSIKSNIYYNIKLDKIKNVLTLDIVNKTKQDIFLLKPEVLFLKENINDSTKSNSSNDRMKFETIIYDSLKKDKPIFKNWKDFQNNLTNLWKRRKIRQNNNRHFDYGYNLEDYLVFIEKNKSYKEQYFINCSKTDIGRYKIIFDTSFREDSLVNDFVSRSWTLKNLYFYKNIIDYPNHILIEVGSRNGL